MKGLKLENLHSPTFVVGLPGIGNVGKIVTDYIIEHLNAKEVGKFYVDTPPMVFPTQDGIEFQSVRMYYAGPSKNGKRNGKNGWKKDEKKGGFLFIAAEATSAPSSDARSAAVPGALTSSRLLPLPHYPS